MATNDLIVYVTGISGKCSRDYTGCGKSCLCHQFMYNEYMEEPYSTLLQAEFDSPVINQQHTIYWGQKEQTYTMSNENISMNSVSVNFKVFEHTVLYQDDTNEPFPENDNYENRIFTHHDYFLNKHSFKSRKSMLNPEEYDSKKFQFSTDLDIPVAYLYVVDVSQTCTVFESQIQLMSRLVKSIQKKHCCVVVASKFDNHCKANVKFLETFANTMNLNVIKCSSKYNANVNTAFECLAVEALSLKEDITRTEDAISTQWHTFYHTDKKLRGISLSDHDLRHLSTSIQPVDALHLKKLSGNYDDLSALDKTDHRKRNRLSTAFSKVLFSRKAAKATKHHITLPVTYKQNDHKSMTEQYSFLTCEYNNQTVSSCPNLSRTLPGGVKSKRPYGRPISSLNELHSNSRPVSERLEGNLPARSSHQTNHVKQHHRAMIPLPLTPLDLAISKSSTSSSSSTDSVKKDCSLSPTLQGVFDDIDVVTRNYNHGTRQKHDYKHTVNGQRNSTPASDGMSNGELPQTTHELESTAKATEHHLTIPVTYLQNDHESTVEQQSFLTCQYSNQTTLSCPDLSRTLPGGVKSKHPYDHPSSSLNELHSNSRAVPERLGEHLPVHQTNHVKQHYRASMPLPLTPLDLATSKNSASSSITSASTNSEVSGCSLSPPLPTIFDDIDVVTRNHNHGTRQKHDNNYVAFTVNSQRNSTPIGDGIRNEELLQTTHEPMALWNKDTTTFDEDTTTFDEDIDYVISDYEFRQMQQTSPLDDYTMIIFNPTTGVKDRSNRDYAQIEENCICARDDNGNSRCITFGDECITITSTKQDETSASQNLDADDEEDYVFMHKITCTSLRNNKQACAYDYTYIDELYTQMLRQRRSGVPPRNVKRVGYTPSTNISTYNSNAMKSHNATYVNCSKLRVQLQRGNTTLLPPRQCYATNSDRMAVMPPRNIPRPGCYLSAPPAN